jgi:ankyrin repeat protein
MWSAIRNQYRVFDLLLSNGSDVLAKDFQGHSVWFYIVKYNSLECAKILILNLHRYHEAIESH